MAEKSTGNKRQSPPVPAPDGARKAPGEGSGGRHRRGAGGRRAPVRTCVGCQEAKTKRELLRVVHTPAGTVEVDSTGKKAGRGAYVCPKKGCWELALKKHALERALKTEISPDDLAVLQAFATSL